MRLRQWHLRPVAEVEMRAISPRTRIIALLPLAALGVHCLRYQLAYGAAADHELAAQGHQYLTSLVPIMVLAAALVAAELIARLNRAWRSQDGHERAPRFVKVAASAAIALVLIYAGQELLEGLCATGHPDGLAGVFGEGGWWSVPVAVVFGAAIAALLRAADAAVSLVARARWVAPSRSERGEPQPKPAAVFVPPPSPLASAAPGRAPPLLSAA